MDTAATARPLQGHRLDLGFAIVQSWRLFLKDIGALVIGGLLACVLTVLSLGILAGPLMAGLYGMVVKRVRDGVRPEATDVFDQMDRFWQFLWAAIVLVVLIGLASITIVGGVLLATVWLYVFPLMVDRGMGLGEALKTSKDMVLDGGFWENLALVIVLVILSSLAHGIVTLLATPFLVALIVTAYLTVAGDGARVEQAGRAAYAGSAVPADAIAPQALEAPQATEPPAAT